MSYQPNGFYYNPMTNPYQNAIPAPWQNPYQNNVPAPSYQPAPQFQQPQIPQPQPFVPIQIHGHTIKDENAEIAPNDIPMDGSVSLFPTEDYSCIFAKHWNKDGKITTTKFVPVPIDEDYTPTPGFEDEMRSRMDELKDLIQRNSNRSYGGKRYQNNHGNQKQDGDQNA